MTRLFLAAALAAIALPLPAMAGAAPKAATSAASPTIERAHIRTTLHGDKGPLIVLIPGMSTPGAVWDDTVAAMKGDHRLLVVDVRGFDGERVAANERQGMIAGIVADLSADLKARGINQATLAGHSFGGLVAMQFALDHPAQTGRVMIVDALPFFGTVFASEATVTSVKTQAEAMRAMMVNGAEAMRAAGAKGTTSGDGAAGMALSPEARVKIANWSLKAEPLVVAEALYEDLMLDLRRDIARIAAPVTVLYQAEQDAAAASKRYQTDYAALPGVRLVPVAKTSHFIMLDRPELFHSELRAFVKR